MACTLLHTPVRSYAKTPGHGVIVRGGMHYMMLPARADKKRQGVTYGAFYSRLNSNMTRPTLQEGCLEPQTHGRAHSHTQTTAFHMQKYEHYGWKQLTCRQYLECACCIYSLYLYP